MKQNKQTIKLNESQLRKMIKEALNELDWKTAVTAANKSRKLTHDKLANYGYQSFAEPHEKWGNETKEKQKKEIERRLKQSKNLSNFATDALRKKFGLQSYYNNLNGVGNEYPELRDDDYGYDPRNSEQVYRVHKPWAPRLDDFEKSPLTDMPQDFQDKAKELKDFQSGNYDYTPEKGWHLKESKLNKIIKESIKKVLNEIYSTDGMGWMGLKFDEEDWTPVNEQSDGNTCFKIKVWCGSGPSLTAFKSYADHGDYEGALEALVAYLDKEGDNSYFTDEWTSDEIEELRKKGYSEEEIYNEIEKWGDFYIDATPLGASKPHWLRGENLAIQEFPN
jgi:hypothetical protein